MTSNLPATRPDAEPDTAVPELPTVSPADALHAAKPPVGTGSAPLFAQLVALALVVIGVVAVQHLLVRIGAVTGSSWLAATVDAADGIDGRSALVLVVGVIALALGVLLLPVVFKRRPRKGLALTATTGIHLRPRDLARIAEARLDDVGPVTSVSASATRRRIRVRAATTEPADRRGPVGDEVRRTLGAVLSPLERQPKVKITVHDESD